MKKLSQLVLLSTLFQYQHNTEKERLPKWLVGLLSSLSKDYHYRKSVMYRYSWKGYYYYHLEIPNDDTVFCQIMNQKGDFIKWPEKYFQEYLDGRAEEKLIWEFE